MNHYTVAAALALIPWTGASIIVLSRWRRWNERDALFATVLFLLGLVGLLGAALVVGGGAR